MEISGILFDMDGVLVDSEPVITEAAIRALREFGVETCEADYKPFTGMGEIAFLGGAARARGGDYVPEMKARTYEIYGEIVDEKLKVYPDTGAVLRALAEKYPLALASSADRVKIRHNLRVAGIPGETFAAIIAAEDVEKKKPHPDIYLKAASTLGIAPERCLVVEDALSGVRAGKAAGALVAAVTTSFPEPALRDAGADFMAESLSALMRLL